MDLRSGPSPFRIEDSSMTKPANLEGSKDSIIDDNPPLLCRTPLAGHLHNPHLAFGTHLVLRAPQQSVWLNTVTLLTAADVPKFNQVAQRPPLADQLRHSERC